MSLRGFVILAVVLSALGFAWHKRERLQAAVAPEPLVVISPGGGGDASPQKQKPGALRKCVNGQQVSYSNVECPAGTKEQRVDGGSVNVVPATPVARSADPRSPGSSAPSSLHEAMGLTRDEQLAEKIRQRAIEGATR